jgi:hypothetical protein
MPERTNHLPAGLLPKYVLVIAHLDKLIKYIILFQFPQIGICAGNTFGILHGRILLHPDLHTVSKAITGNLQRHFEE